MKRPELAALGILLAGNVILWTTSVVQQQERSFDFQGFETSVREIFAEESLQSFRFEQETLLPDEYLYLESTARDRPLLSVYAGYYPRQGPLAGRPHDPVLCYKSFGWEIEEGPTSIEVVGTSEAEDTWYASRLLARHQGERRIVLYWLQEGGMLPRYEEGYPPWYEEVSNRLSTGRSDQAWIRLELDPARVSFPLDAVWQQRVRRTMLTALNSLN